MRVSRFILVFSLFFTAFLPSRAEAVEALIEASIRTRAAIAATNGQDIYFGNIHYDNQHEGVLELGTDSIVRLSENAKGIKITGGPTAGKLVFSGDGQSTVDISCTRNAVVRAKNKQALKLKNVKLSVNKGTSWRSAIPCSGLKKPSMSLDLGADPEPGLLFGGAVDVSGSRIKAKHSYSAANPGGHPVAVRIVYQ